MSHYSPRPEGVTLGQQMQIDQMLLSCPRKFIDACRQATVYSLGCLPVIDLLRERHPQRYALLVAEAEAQGFPV